MLIDSAYNFGQIVYLKTDVEQLARMITAAIVTPQNILYELSCGVTTTKHYDVEFSVEKNELIKVI